MSFCLKVLDQVDVSMGVHHHVLGCLVRCWKDKDLAIQLVGDWAHGDGELLWVSKVAKGSVHQLHVESLAIHVQSDWDSNNIAGSGQSVSYMEKFSIIRIGTIDHLDLVRDDLQIDLVLKLIGQSFILHLEEEHSTV